MKMSKYKGYEITSDVIKKWDIIDKESYEKIQWQGVKDVKLYINLCSIILIRLIIIIVLSMMQIFSEKIIMLIALINLIFYFIIVIKYVTSYHRIIEDTEINLKKHIDFLEDE